MKYDSTKLIKVIKDNKSREFDEDVHHLNIIGIRSSNKKVNAFNDIFILIMKMSDGTTMYYEFPGTTKPGVDGLLIPANPKGCAIVKPGFYKNVWVRGYHKGKRALVQSNKITVIRDFDKDKEFDYDSGVEESGIFGIDFHRAGLNSEIVANWSLGCQVSKKKTDLDLLMKYADIQFTKTSFKYFSFNLLTEKEAEPALA